MKNTKRIICVSLIAASFFTGCNSQMNQKAITEEDNIGNADYIECNDDAFEVLNKYGKGCNIFNERESFEKNGMVITVNSSRITKEHGNWDNYKDFFPNEDDGVISDASCYVVVNMDIYVKDKENYPLGFCGFNISVIDKTTGEWKDGSGIVSSTYYDKLDDEEKKSDDLFIDYPKENEDIIGQDFIFYIEDDNNINENMIFCLEVEERSRAIACNQGKDYVSLVKLQPTDEL